MKILIFNPLHIFFDESSLDSGAVGGSETWAIQLADAFQFNGHQCYNVCYCGSSHVSKTGVHYVDRSDLTSLQYEKFDFAICSRLVSIFYKLLNAFNFTDNYFVMLHDDSCPDLNDNVFSDKRCLNVITLSDWHMNLIHSKYNLPAEKTSIIKNGIDVRLFDECIYPKKQYDHSILWSTCFERGLDILSEHIAPIVRLKIPDFNVYATSYSDTRFNYSNLNIRMLPPMSKKQLYAEMYKHAVWFYPSSVSETFCITAIENMMCDVNVIMYPNYGTLTYEKLIDPLQFSFDDAKTFDTAVKAAAEKIIFYIDNFNSNENIKLRERARHWVINNCTWNKTAEDFITLYGETHK